MLTIRLLLRATRTHPCWRLRVCRTSLRNVSSRTGKLGMNPIYPSVLLCHCLGIIPGTWAFRYFQPSSGVGHTYLQAEGSRRCSFCRLSAGDRQQLYPLCGIRCGGVRSKTIVLLQRLQGSESLVLTWVLAPRSPVTLSQL